MKHDDIVAKIRAASPEQYATLIKNFDELIQVTEVKLETLKELRKGYERARHDYYIKPVGESTRFKQEYRLIRTTDNQQEFYGSAKDIKNYIERNKIKDEVGNYNEFF